MPSFEKGQTFLDRRAINIDGTKSKYFIALSDAEDEDDRIVCFVMNTQKFIERYHYKCNKSDLRYIIGPKTFSFIDRDTSIMLSKEALYTFKEICQENIKLLDIASDLLVREIRNCIDWNFILPLSKKIIDSCFK